MSLFIDPWVEAAINDTFAALRKRVEDADATKRERVLAFIEQQKQLCDAQDPASIFFDRRLTQYTAAKRRSYIDISQKWLKDNLNRWSSLQFTTDDFDKWDTFARTGLWLFDGDDAASSPLSADPRSQYDFFVRLLKWRALAESERAVAKPPQTAKKKRAPIRAAAPSTVVVVEEEAIAGEEAAKIGKLVQQAQSTFEASTLADPKAPAFRERAGYLYREVVGALKGWTTAHGDLVDGANDKRLLAYYEATERQRPQALPVVQADLQAFVACFDAQGRVQGSFTVIPALCAVYPGTYMDPVTGSYDSAYRPQRDEGRKVAHWYLRVLGLNSLAMFTSSGVENAAFNYGAPPSSDNGFVQWWASRFTPALTDAEALAPLLHTKKELDSGNFDGFAINMLPFPRRFGDESSAFDLIPARFYYQGNVGKRFAHLARQLDRLDDAPAEDGFLTTDLGQMIRTQLDAQRELAKNYVVEASWATGALAISDSIDPRDGYIPTDVLSDWVNASLQVNFERPDTTNWFYPGVDFSQERDRASTRPTGPRWAVPAAVFDPDGVYATGTISRYNEYSSSLAEVGGYKAAKVKILRSDLGYDLYIRRPYTLRPVDEAAANGTVEGLQNALLTRFLAYPDEETLAEARTNGLVEAGLKPLSQCVAGDEIFIYAPVSRYGLRSEDNAYRDEISDRTRLFLFWLNNDYKNFAPSGLYSLTSRTHYGEFQLQDLYGDGWANVEWPEGYVTWASLVGTENCVDSTAWTGATDPSGDPLFTYGDYALMVAGGQAGWTQVAVGALQRRQTTTRNFRDPSARRRLLSASVNALTDEEIDAKIFKPTAARFRQMLSDQRAEMYAEGYRRDFRSWLAKANPAYRERLVEAYGAKFAAYTTPDYDYAASAVVPPVISDTLARLSPVYKTDSAPLFAEEAMALENAREARRAITPYAYQSSGARRLVKERGGLLAFDVGVGKTLTALLALGKARQEGAAKRPVICVPNSLVGKWKRDVEDHFPGMRAVSIGSKLVVKTQVPSKGRYSRQKLQISAELGKDALKRVAAALGAPAGFKSKAFRSKSATGQASLASIYLQSVSAFETGAKYGKGANVYVEIPSTFVHGNYVDLSDDDPTSGDLKSVVIRRSVVTELTNNRLRANAFEAGKPLEPDEAAREKVIREMWPFVQKDVLDMARDQLASLEAEAITLRGSAFYANAQITDSDEKKTTVGKLFAGVSPMGPVEQKENAEEQVQKWYDFKQGRYDVAICSHDAFTSGSPLRLDPDRVEDHIQQTAALNREIEPTLTRPGSPGRLLLDRLNNALEGLNEAVGTASSDTLYAPREIAVQAVVVGDRAFVMLDLKDGTGAHPADVDNASYIIKDVEAEPDPMNPGRLDMLHVRVGERGGITPTAPLIEVGTFIHVHGSWRRVLKADQRPSQGSRPYLRQYQALTITPALNVPASGYVRMWRKGSTSLLYVGDDRVNSTPKWTRGLFGVSEGRVGATGNEYVNSGSAPGWMGAGGWGVFEYASNTASGPSTTRETVKGTLSRRGLTDTNSGSRYTLPPDMQVRDVSVSPPRILTLTDEAPVNPGFNLEVDLEGNGNWTPLYEARGSAELFMRRAQPGEIAALPQFMQDWPPGVVGTQRDVYVSAFVPAVAPVAFNLGFTTSVPMAVDAPQTGLPVARHLPVWYALRDANGETTGECLAVLRSSSVDDMEYFWRFPGGLASGDSAYGWEGLNPYYRGSQVNWQIKNAKKGVTPAMVFAGHYPEGPPDKRSNMQPLRSAAATGDLTLVNVDRVARIQLGPGQTALDYVSQLEQRFLSPKTLFRRQGARAWADEYISGKRNLVDVQAFYVMLNTLRFPSVYRVPGALNDLRSIKDLLEQAGIPLPELRTPYRRSHFCGDYGIEASYAAADYKFVQPAATRFLTGFVISVEGRYPDGVARTKSADRGAVLPYLYPCDLKLLDLAASRLDQMRDALSPNALSGGTPPKKRVNNYRFENYDEKIQREVPVHLDFSREELLDPYIYEGRGAFVSVETSDGPTLKLRPQIGIIDGDRALIYAPWAAAVLRFLLEVPNAVRSFVTGPLSAKLPAMVEGLEQAANNAEDTRWEPEPIYLPVPTNGGIGGTPDLLVKPLEVAFSDQGDGGVRGMPAMREIQRTRTETVVPIVRYARGVSTVGKRPQIVAKTDAPLAFHEVGVDCLIVDEAHNFKALFTPGPRGKLEGGQVEALVMGAVSKAAVELEFRASQIRGAGGSVFLLTATPASTSPIDFYNMLHFLGPDEHTTVFDQVGIHDQEQFITRYITIEDEIVAKPGKDPSERKAATAFTRTTLGEFRLTFNRYGNRRVADDSPWLAGTNLRLNAAPETASGQTHDDGAAWENRPTGADGIPKGYFYPSTADEDAWSAQMESGDVSGIRLRLNGSLAGDYPVNMLSRTEDGEPYLILDQLFPSAGDAQSAGFDAQLKPLSWELFQGARVPGAVISEVKLGMQDIQQARYDAYSQLMGQSNRGAATGLGSMIPRMSNCAAHLALDLLGFETRAAGLEAPEEEDAGTKVTAASKEPVFASYFRRALPAGDVQEGKPVQWSTLTPINNESGDFFKSLKSATPTGVYHEDGLRYRMLPSPKRTANDVSIDQLVIPAPKLPELGELQPGVIYAPQFSDPRFAAFGPDTMPATSECRIAFRFAGEPPKTGTGSLANQKYMVVFRGHMPSAEMAAVFRRVTEILEFEQRQGREPDVSRLIQEQVVWRSNPLGGVALNVPIAAMDDGARYEFIPTMALPRIYFDGSVPDQVTQPSSVLAVRSGQKLQYLVVPLDLNHGDNLYRCLGAPFDGSDNRVYASLSGSSVTRPIILGDLGRFDNPTLTLFADFFRENASDIQRRRARNFLLIESLARILIKAGSGNPEVGMEVLKFGPRNLRLDGLPESEAIKKAALQRAISFLTQQTRRGSQAFRLTP